MFIENSVRLAEAAFLKFVLVLDHFFGEVAHDLMEMAANYFESSFEFVLGRHAQI